jgi:hypothetical protein
MASGHTELYVLENYITANCKTIDRFARKEKAPPSCFEKSLTILFQILKRYYSTCTFYFNTVYLYFILYLLYLRDVTTISKPASDIIWSY